MSDLAEKRKPHGFARRLLFTFAVAVKPLVRHPATNVVLGLGLVLTGLLELIEGMVTGFEAKVQTLHAIVLFGFVTALRGILELVEAAEVFALSDLELEGDLPAGRAGAEISHRPLADGAEMASMRQSPPDGGTS